MNVKNLRLEPKPDLTHHGESDFVDVDALELLLNQIKAIKHNIQLNKHRLTP